MYDYKATWYLVFHEIIIDINDSCKVAVTHL